MSGRAVSRRVIARTLAAKLIAEPARRAYWLQALAAYLLEQRRAHELDLIINDIAHELYEQEGQLYVEVTSARPLDAVVRKQLTDTLAELTDAKQVELTESVDSSLIGGLIARTPDAVLDQSVRAKIKQLATIK